MGPIQSSLNQLTLGALGAVAAVSKGLRGEFKKPQTPAKTSTKALPSAKTSDYAVMGNTTYTIGNEAAAMSDFAATKGNDMIKQKFRSTKVKERLASIRKRKGK